jgi:putative ABC transport system permease protein
MNQSIRIAYRNVGRQKKRTFLLAGAVGIGFFLITLVGGFTGGLAESARQNFSQLFGGHLYFSGSLVSGRNSVISVMANPEPLESVIAAYKDRITSVQKRSSSSGTLIFGTKELRQSIAGVNFTAEKNFRSSLKLVAGSLEKIMEPSSLVLPDDVAKKLNVSVGESVLFKNSTVYAQQNVTEFIVIATFVGQSTFGVSSGYANLSTINILLGLKADEYQSLNIWLRDESKIDETANLIYSDLSKVAPVAARASSNGQDSQRDMMARFIGGTKKVAAGESWKGTKYSISTLNELMSQFTTIIGTIDSISLWIFVILMLITMVGVMNSFRMIMVERTGEIGTMRALGVHRSGIRDIFLWEALLITLSGAIAGYLIALAVMGIASVPTLSGASILSFFLDKSHLAFKISLLEAIRNIAILAVFSLIAVSFPARAAAKLEPAVALRTAI